MKSTRILILSAGLMLPSCAPVDIPTKINPSLDYARKIRMQSTQAQQQPFQSPAQAVAAQRSVPTNVQAQFANNGRAINGRTPQVRFVDGGWEAQEGADAEIVTNEQGPDMSAITEYRASMSDSAPYRGPLAYGEPGVTSSLWGESRAENDMFRDHRAYQPMDLITILVNEDSEGEKEADTETKSSSNMMASITNLLGLEKYAKRINRNIELDQMIAAETSNNFKGEGSTSRKDSLVARISAMVVEVLPSGILRIEGEKIVAVNNEEQVMVISGLVRTRDIDSNNQVDSSKVANMRIDYYGRGAVGEAQYGGWLGRALRIIWPF